MTCKDLETYLAIETRCTVIVTDWKLPGERRDAGVNVVVILGQYSVDLNIRRDESEGWAAVVLKEVKRGLAGIGPVLVG